MSIFRILTILSIVLIYISFQNCSGGSSPVKFFTIQNSLISQAMNGGNGYDGKPAPGNYCRVFDELKCQAQVDGLQSLLNVDQDGLHLKQDNCAMTSIEFSFGHAGVNYTPLQPDHIAVSRGIFVKCDIDANKQPVLPKEMPDAFCVSENQQFSVVINKDIRNSELTLSAAYKSDSGARAVSAKSINKVIDSSNNINYASNEFSLNIKKSNSQTSTGIMKIIIDEQNMEMNLSCRIAGPQPTVIIENDMELSSTWIDMSQLVGYWKLNESNAMEGRTILDSSLFATSGTLLTGNDGLVKSDGSAKGGAISLDGTDSISILRPADGHLDFGIRSFSYMIWIKKSGSLGSFDMPFYHGGGTVNDAGFDIECGTFCVAAVGDGSGVVGKSQKSAQFFLSDTPFIGRWTLLVAVVDRANQQLRTYVNGNLIDTKSISSIGSVTSNKEFRFGGIPDGRHQFLGSIDDVAIWNKALTDSEILEIYQRLRPKFY